MTLRTPAARVRLLTSVALSAAVSLASAGNLTFLKSSPLAHFKQDDYELMMKNIRQVLESAAPDARQEWHNPKTKSGGVAQVRGQFIASDGVPCKRLRVANEAGGVKGEATDAWCKYEGRGWLLNPDAVPAE